MKQLGKLASALGLVALAIGGVVLSGYILMTFWLWFVVPLGAPPIGLAIAVGGMMILRLALLDTSEAEAIIKEDKRTMRDRWVRTRWPRARQGRGARLRLGARGFRAVTFSALPLRYLRAG